jgi:CRISPR-associated protein Cas5d
MTVPVPLEVRVWGDLACFTRPEMKVERVSYPVMTPSAARGVLEAIFWKPEFTWQVREIHVLREIRYASFVRNEVSTRQSLQAARGWATAGGGYAVQDDRTQRHTLALRDVAYVIRADMQLRRGVTDDIAKYRDQFRRRVTRGQCFSTPYLGCREFAASFGQSEPSEQPISLTDSLGSMLLDIEYTQPGSGTGQPRFFDARLESGILRVPSMPTMYGGG